jgi:hypothetical protein
MVARLMLSTATHFVFILSHLLSLAAEQKHLALLLFTDALHQSARRSTNAPTASMQQR